MPVQDTVGRRTDGGLRPGTPLGKSSASFDPSYLVGGRTNQIEQITIDTANNTTLYSYQVTGEDGTTETISYTSDASATKPEIQAGLIADHQGNDNANRRVEAYSSSTDKIILEGRRTGDDFALAESHADLSTATTQSASDGAAIAPGRMVMKASGESTCELPSSTVTPQVTTITPSSITNNENLIVRVIVDTDLVGESEQYEGRITLDGTATIQEAVEALDTELTAQLPGSFTITEDDSVLTITGPGDGQRFEVVAFSTTAADAKGTTVLTVATPTAGVPIDFTRPLLGLALMSAREGIAPNETDSEHGVGTTVRVRAKGHGVAEVEPGINPSVGDPVYVRTTASGTKLIGMLTNVADSGNVIRRTDIRWTDEHRGTWGTKTGASVYVDI